MRGAGPGSTTGNYESSQSLLWLPLDRPGGFGGLALNHPRPQGLPLRFGGGGHITVNYWENKQCCENY